MRQRARPHSVMENTRQLKVPPLGGPPSDSTRQTGIVALNQTWIVALKVFLSLGMSGVPQGPSDDAASHSRGSVDDPGATQRITSHHA